MKLRNNLKLVVLLTTVVLLVAIMPMLLRSVFDIEDEDESWPREPIMFKHNGHVYDRIGELKRAAENGDAVLQYEVGLLLNCRRGDFCQVKGVSGNPEAAEEWFRKAAAQGHVDAKLSLEEIEKPRKH
ncbi:MAG: hypothetical protein LBR05_05515 [Azoarcus sp.]|jgi:hypothetical protein|nr:hypothetical protein [Azoarcus sp.]